MQTPLLLRRHRQLHRAVLAFYLALVVFVASMFVIGLAGATDSAILATSALVTFLFATAILLVGLLFTVAEVAAAQRALEFEVRRVSDLPRTGAAGDASGRAHQR